MNRTAHLLAGMLIGVLLTASRFVSAGAVGQDPAQLAPKMYHVIFDNDRYRVIEYRLEPGGKEPMHSHPNGALVYSFSNAEMRITLPDGGITEAHSKAGEVLWRNPVTHKGENIGRTEAHSLLIEPKGPCK